MAKTVQPRIDPLSGGAPGGRPPIDDERELLETGTQGVPSNIAKQPILGSYLPVNPVQRQVCSSKSKICFISFIAITVTFSNDRSVLYKRPTKPTKR